MHTFSVLLSGEHTPWLHSLAQAFEQNPVFRNIEISTPLDTLARAELLQPDVLIWRPDAHDPALPVRELISHCPFLVPIAIVQDPNILDLLDLLKSGLCGCLPLRLRPRQIVLAVDMIVSEGLVCLPRLSSEGFRRLLKSRFQRRDSILDHLTVREREIFHLLSSNYSNQEIAAHLCLAESTVKSHLHNIFRKLGVRNRSEAITALYHS